MELWMKDSGRREVRFRNVPQCHACPTPQSVRERLVDPLAVRST